MRSRILLAVGFLMTLISGIGHSANADYTLYYLDSTKNVCSVSVDASGELTGEAKRLTTGGIYDSYSVSPDEKTVAGFSRTSWTNSMDLFKGFIERDGHQTGKPVSEMRGDFPPHVDWSPASRFAFISYGYEDFILIWDIMARRQVDDLIANYPARPITTDDERYMLIMDYIDVPGAPGHESGGLYAFDLKTGKTGKIAEIEYMDSNYNENCGWIPKSDTCAFIDMAGKVWIAKISSDKRKVSVSKRPLTRFGGCSDLRTSGAGVYFVQTVSGKKTAYCSTDLKSVRQCKMLAARPPLTFPTDPPWDKDPRLPKNAWRQYAVGTADGALLVCPVDAGKDKMPTLTIFDKSGNSHPIAPGKMPMWKGAPHIF